MRGLKRETDAKVNLSEASHLLQMRGLKQIKHHLQKKTYRVASFTDAWIETVPPADVAGPIMSHLLQMRGLKQKLSNDYKSFYQSHLLQMRGLKHFSLDWEHHRHKVASFTDAWIETKDLFNAYKIESVASFTDAWIETQKADACL